MMHHMALAYSFGVRAGLPAAAPESFQRFRQCLQAFGVRAGLPAAAPESSSVPPGLWCAGWAASGSPARTPKMPANCLRQFAGKKRTA